MIDSTTIVMGPGGVGKGPLDAVFKDSVHRLDPYRLRRQGPKRDRDDPFYAHPKLRDELQLILATAGEKSRWLSSEVEWFPNSGALFFCVRGEWQLLLLLPLRFTQGHAKLEFFAPVLPTLLDQQEIAEVFGAIEILLLNPASKSVANSDDLSELQEKTRENCQRRRDSGPDLETRVQSIVTEAPAWRTVLSQWGEIVTEMTDWEFPEWAFQRAGSVEKQKALLQRARDCIIRKNARFRMFFKSDEEIDRIAVPIVQLR